MKASIKKVIKKIKGEGFDYEKDFITGGYISSFDLIFLISELEKEFFITIPLDEIEPQNFNSVDEICEMLKKLQDDEKEDE